MDKVISISKILTANDVGETGGHQAGITVLKDESMLSFFPDLDATMINPRIEINARDKQTGKTFVLRFIYYNGRLHGTSTRNEYRLTGLTEYFRQNGARKDDELRIEKGPGDELLLSLIDVSNPSISEQSSPNATKLQLSGKWSTYKIRKS